MKAVTTHNLLLFSTTQIPPNTTCLVCVFLPSCVGTLDFNGEGTAREELGKEDDDDGMQEEERSLETKVNVRGRIVRTVFSHAICLMGGEVVTLNNSCAGVRDVESLSLFRSLPSHQRIRRLTVSRTNHCCIRKRQEETCASVRDAHPKQASCCGRFTVGK